MTTPDRDEMIETIVGLSKDERELLLLKTMLTKIEYRMNKRLLRSETGARLIKETHKSITEFERRVKKARISIKNKN